MRKRRCTHFIPGVRRRLLARDKGVCAICTKDCLKERAPWEADHVVALAEGGDPLSFENYRTLCLTCHKTETKKLSKRLREKGHKWGRPKIDPADHLEIFSLRLHPKELESIERAAKAAGLRPCAWIRRELSKVIQR